MKIVGETALWNFQLHDFVVLCYEKFPFDENCWRSIVSKIVESEYCKVHRMTPKPSQLPWLDYAYLVHNTVGGSNQLDYAYLVHNTVGGSSQLDYAYNY